MMQNIKMEPNEQTTQVVNQQNGGTAIQVMPTVLGTANGQQILLQSLQQTLGGNGQQSIQVVPIQALGNGGTIIVQPQVQHQPQPQIVQLPDGQTFIYQPMIAETQAQPQIVNINGNFYQIPTQQAAPAQTSIQSSPANTSQNQPNQQVSQVVMMTTNPSTQQPTVETQNTVSNIINTSATSPTIPPNTSSPAPLVESEEEPLYVNASAC
jgi:nuclear transcription factor Y alpha